MKQNTNSTFQENIFEVVFQISPTFFRPEQNRYQIADDNFKHKTRVVCVLFHVNYVSVISSQCVSDICMHHEYRFVKIIFLNLPNNSAHKGLLESKWNAWLWPFRIYQINQAIAINRPSAWVLLQLVGVTVGVSGKFISTLPWEIYRDFHMTGHPIVNSLIFQSN